MPGNTDLRLGLRKASQAVTGLLGRRRPPVNISGPQLVRRTTHVSFDPDTRSYQGVPTRWQTTFEEHLASAATTTAAAAAAAAAAPAMSSASSSSSSSATTPTAATATATATAAGPQSPAVWFDSYCRRFVNLPIHWRERLQRNGLTEWAEFQRNPSLLSMVFSLMDEELQAMDLESLGLDATFYSSATPGDGKSIDTAPGAAKAAKNVPATSAASRSSTAGGGGGVVWTQQRSFVRDDDSDSEEVAEL